MKITVSHLRSLIKEALAAAVDVSSLEDDLRGFDWYYEMSDDHRVWSAGNDKMKEMRMTAARIASTPEGKSALMDLKGSFDPKSRAFMFLNTYTK